MLSLPAEHCFRGSASAPRSRFVDHGKENARGTATPTARTLPPMDISWLTNRGVGPGCLGRGPAKRHSEPCLSDTQEPRPDIAGRVPRVPCCLWPDERKGGLA